MSYTDKELVELLATYEAEPSTTISYLAQALISTRGGIRRVMDMSEDISWEAREALERLLK